MMTNMWMTPKDLLKVKKKEEKEEENYWKMIRRK